MRGQDRKVMEMAAAAVAAAVAVAVGGTLLHPVTDLADLLHHLLVVPNLARARRHDGIAHLAFPV